MAADKSDSNNVQLVAESLEGEDKSAKTSENKTPDAPKPGSGGPLKKLRTLTKRFNIYIAGLVLLIVVVGAVVTVIGISQRNAAKTTVTNSSLSPEALKQLSKADVTVGDPKQVLKVQSSAVFDDKVLVKGSLDVAGTINVGGALSLPGITVSGESQFESVDVSKTLNIGGDATVQGQLAVRRGITISGSGTFGGTVAAPQVSTSKLQLLGDLVMTNHLLAGGPTPGRTSGGSLGSGGTSSVSGSDTAGTVNLNTGSNPSSGCLLTVNFASRYTNTPRVVITPLNAPSSAQEYYVTRTTSGFTICSFNSPSAGTGYGFDYIVFG